MSYARFPQLSDSESRELENLLEKDELTKFELARCDVLFDKIDKVQQEKSRASDLAWFLS